MAAIENWKSTLSQVVPQPENLVKLIFLFLGEKTLLDATKQRIPEDKTYKAKPPEGSP